MNLTSIWQKASIIIAKKSGIQIGRIKTIPWKIAQKNWDNEAITFLNGHLEAPKLSNMQHEHSILGLYLCIFPITIHVICKERQEILIRKIWLRKISDCPWGESVRVGHCYKEEF